MSIVRIGLGETKGYHDGFDAIFGKKKVTEKPAAVVKKPAPKKPAAKKPAAKKKSSSE